jgi:hypothetical protein
VNAVTDISGTRNMELTANSAIATFSLRRKLGENLLFLRVKGKNGTNI